MTLAMQEAYGSNVCTGPGEDHPDWALRIWRVGAVCIAAWTQFWAVWPAKEGQTWAPEKWA